MAAVIIITITMEITEVIITVIAVETMAEAPAGIMEVTAVIVETVVALIMEMEAIAEKIVMEKVANRHH